MTSWRAFVVVTVVVVATIQAARVPAMAQAAATLPCTFEPGPTRAVAAVIDGDTIRLDDRIEVRLIGTLAPSEADAQGSETAAWPPADAAKAALEQLVAGKTVALAFAGPRSDRHGRVLAHLFVGSGDDQVWVQGRMVETGHARAHFLPEGDACAAPLLGREKHARNAGLGLWASAAYQVRPGDRPSELTRYRNTFQLVRGRVERAFEARGVTIVELASGERKAADPGQSQRGAFRIVWRRSLAGRAGLPRASELEGKNVLVHGWIGARRFPELEIQSAGQLEIEE